MQNVLNEFQKIMKLYINEDGAMIGNLCGKILISIHYSGIAYLN